MTTLIVDNFAEDETKEQGFTVSTRKRLSFGCISPYIYLHNNPAGNFTLELLKDADIILTNTFTSSDIKSALETSLNYSHVFYPVIPLTMIQLSEGDYTLKISCSGYSPSSLSYIGWIRQFEDLNNEISYVPSSDFENPLAFRLKDYKR